MMRNLLNKVRNLLNTVRNLLGGHLSGKLFELN
jgi:hypothetical protein